MLDIFLSDVINLFGTYQRLSLRYGMSGTVNTHFYVVRTSGGGGFIDPLSECAC